VERPTLLSHKESRRRRGVSGRLALVLLPLLVALSGCASDSPIRRAWLPGQTDTTNQTARITHLWVGSWIAAMSVGVLVWGLILWCVVAYRRRRDDVGLPEQVRYHVPLEIMYTIIPLMMIGVLFVYTAKDQSEITDTSKPADVHIDVVAKQWSWDFNYLDSKVYEVGLQGELNGEPGVEKELPTLYLPVNKRVEFTLHSRDVIHSFWVPAFLYKLDAIPGVTNKFQLVPQKEGTYAGKCAELCGEYHSEMLFNVAVVSQADYDAHIKALEEQGHVGTLDTNLGRSRTRPGGGAVPGNTQTAEAVTGSNE
jgi:cytochrome c oxidase subunit 2